MDVAIERQVIKIVEVNVRNEKCLLPDNLDGTIYNSEYAGLNRNFGHFQWAPSDDFSTFGWKTVLLYDTDSFLMTKINPSRWYSATGWRQTIHLVFDLSTLPVFRFVCVINKSKQRIDVCRRFHSSATKLSNRILGFNGGWSYPFFRE